MLQHANSFVKHQKTTPLTVLFTAGFGVMKRRMPQWTNTAVCSDLVISLKTALLKLAASVEMSAASDKILWARSPVHLQLSSTRQKIPQLIRRKRPGSAGNALTMLAPTIPMFLSLLIP